MLELPVLHFEDLAVGVSKSFSKVVSSSGRVAKFLAFTPR